MGSQNSQEGLRRIYSVVWETKDGDAIGRDWKADRICGERQVQFQTPYVAGVGVQQAVGIWNHTGQMGQRVAS